MVLLLNTVYLRLTVPQKGSFNSTKNNRYTNFINVSTNVWTCRKSIFYDFDTRLKDIPQF